MYEARHTAGVFPSSAATAFTTPTTARSPAVFDSGAGSTASSAAAFTVPAGLSIVTTTFPEGPVRNRALAIYAGIGATGFSAGLILGGLLTEIGWRWTFLVPGPIALIVLLAGIKLIPKDIPDPAERKSFDVGGAVTVSAAMLLLVRTVVTAPEDGWSSAQTLGGWFALPGVTALTMGLDGRWSAIRITLESQLIGLALILLGTARAWEDVDTSNALAPVFVAGLAGLFAALLALELRMLRSR